MRNSPFKSTTDFKPLVAVIDPAIREPSIHCINQLMINFNNFRFVQYFPGLSHQKAYFSQENLNGIIILGSSAFITDYQGWMNDITNFSLTSLEKNTPVLGICFGHQLITHSLGGKVDFITQSQNRRAGLKKIEFIRPTLGIAKSEVLHVAQMHRQEVKQLPSMLKQTAQSDEIEFEAVEHKNLPFWGLQCHPESSRYALNEYVGITSPEEQLLASTSGQRILRGFFNEVLKRSAK